MKTRAAVLAAVVLLAGSCHEDDEHELLDVPPLEWPPRQWCPGDPY